MGVLAIASETRTLYKLERRKKTYLTVRLSEIFSNIIMPRGGRAPAPRAAAPAPAPAPAMAAPQQPSMMQQMAVTAGGVAIGNVAGTALTGMIFGSGPAAPAPAAQDPVAPAPVAAPVAAASAPIPEQQLCSMELQDFIRCTRLHSRCTQSQSDVTLCQGFNEVLKECKQKAAMSN